MQQGGREGGYVGLLGSVTRQLQALIAGRCKDVQHIAHQQRTGAAWPALRCAAGGGSARNSCKSWPPACVHERTRTTLVERCVGLASG